jgi:hypothetical protein
MDTELTHALHHPSHCLAPGLFRSLRKGQRKKEKLDVSFAWMDYQCQRRAEMAMEQEGWNSGVEHGQFLEGGSETSLSSDLVGGNCAAFEPAISPDVDAAADSYEIRFVGFEPLGAMDLRLLQGIIALSGPIGEVLCPAPTLAVPMELRRGLAMEEAGKQMNALMLTCRAGKLLAETGMSDGGGNIKILISSLVRMSSVTAIVTRNDEIASYKLLSFSFDGSSKNLSIALNPLLAQAADCSVPYTRIDMCEVRKLKSDVARLIHQRLCGFVNQGRTIKVGLDRLCSYAWFVETDHLGTVRKRRQRIREALHEISGCGWTVTEYQRDKFRIWRPFGKLAVRAPNR